MTQARGNLYIRNGTDGGAVWTGATLTRPGTMPSAKFSVYFNEYNIAAGTSTKKNRVYISELADSSKFTRASGILNNSTEVPGATGAHLGYPQRAVLCARRENQAGSGARGAYTAGRGQSSGRSACFSGGNSGLNGFSFYAYTHSESSVLRGCSTVRAAMESRILWLS